MLPRAPLIPACFLSVSVWGQLQRAIYAQRIFSLLCFKLLSSGQNFCCGNWKDTFCIMRTWGVRRFTQLFVRKNLKRLPIKTREFRGNCEKESRTYCSIFSEESKPDSRCFLQLGKSSVRFRFSVVLQSVHFESRSSPSFAAESSWVKDLQMPRRSVGAAILAWIRENVRGGSQKMRVWTGIRLATAQQNDLISYAFCKSRRLWKLQRAAKFDDLLGPKLNCRRSNCGRDRINNRKCCRKYHCLWIALYVATVWLHPVFWRAQHVGFAVLEPTPPKMISVC